MCFSDLVSNSKVPTLNAQTFPIVGLLFSETSDELRQLDCVSDDVSEKTTPSVVPG